MISRPKKSKIDIHACGAKFHNKARKRTVLDQSPTTPQLSTRSRCSSSAVTIMQRPFRFTPMMKRILLHFTHLIWRLFPGIKSRLAAMLSCLVMSTVQFLMKLTALWLYLEVFRKVSAVTRPQFTTWRQIFGQRSSFPINQQGLAQGPVTQLVFRVGQCTCLVANVTTAWNLMIFGRSTSQVTSGLWLRQLMTKCLKLEVDTHP